MAGVVDLSFSSPASLEVFELDFRSDSPELPVAASGPERRALQSPLLGTAPPFLRRVLARPRLRRARGRQHRRLEPPRAHPLCSVEDKDDAFVARLEKHIGPVRGLEFNPLSDLLASGDDEGELCIWDLANPREPVFFPSLRPFLSSLNLVIGFVYDQHQGVQCPLKFLLRH